MASSMPEQRVVEERPEFFLVPRSGRELEHEGDLVRWGPIIGGLVASVGIMLVLVALGVAVGLAEFGATGTLSATDATLWAVWGAASMFIALFFGGWLAARTSVYGGVFSGIVHGSIVWASFLSATLFLAGIGVSVTAGALANMLPSAVAPGVAPPADVTAAVPAILAFAGLILSYVAAAAGGLWGGLWGSHREPMRRTRHA